MLLWVVALPDISQARDVNCQPVIHMVKNRSLVVKTSALQSRCGHPGPNMNRDPYIIHLNIALSIVVFLFFGGESHFENGQHVSFKEL